MRLTSALVKRTLQQFDSEAIPEDHPAVPALNELFGDHTFFIAGSGLHIVEPADFEEDEENVRTGQVVKLASWKDARKTSLTPHEPEPVDVIVDFEGAGPRGLDGLEGEELEEPEEE